MSSEQPPSPPKPPPHKPLNARQLAFVDAYRGNASEAAREAGYSAHTAAVQGHALLRNPKVAAAIAKQQAARSKASIATREQMQKFFSDTMNDPKAPLRDRLAAAAWLGKTRGDFSTNINVKGDLTVHELVAEAMEKSAE